MINHDTPTSYADYYSFFFSLNQTGRILFVHIYIQNAKYIYLKETTQTKLKRKVT
jgi:hypothetical protein